MIISPIHFLRMSLGCCFFSLLPANGWSQPKVHAPDPGLLFSEAKTKWAIYRSIYLPKLQGTVRSANSDGTVKSRIQVKNGSGCSLLWRETSEPKKDRSEVYAINSDYTFALVKRQANWLLDTVSLDTTQNVFPTGHAIRDVIFWDAAQHFMVYLKPLHDLVDHPSFSVRETKEFRTNDGLDVVQIDFDFKPHIEKNPKMYVPLERGTITLVPSQYWRLLESELHLKYSKSTKNHRSTFKVELIDGNVPILKNASVKTSRSPKGGKIEEDEYVIECDLKFEESKSPADFYLTAFGLPEPKGIQAPVASRWHIWLATAGALLILAAIRWRKRLSFARA